MFANTIEHHLETNATLGLLPELGNEWSISFEFRPTDYILTADTNLMHLTTGEPSSEHGSRTPMIGFEHGANEKANLVVTSSLNSDPNYPLRFVTIPAPKLGEWTKIEIDQRQEGCKYFLVVSLANKEVFRKENENPRNFSNVTVFASNPFLPAQPGSIKNLSIMSNTGE